MKEENFPWTTEANTKLGANTSTKFPPALEKSWYEKRVDLVGGDIPLHWMYLVNVLKSEINRLRRENSIELTEYIYLTIVGMEEQQEYAADYEWKYLYEQCRLSHMRFSRVKLKGFNAEVPSLEFIEGKLVDKYVPINIGFYTPINKIYYAK